MTNHTAEFWAHSFVTQLVSTSHQQSLQPHSARELDSEALVAAYKDAKKRLLLFDYDVSCSWRYSTFLDNGGLRDLVP